MLTYIIQQCYTGFGDCVVGYVSAYLLKKQVEKRWLPSHTITLLIDWNGVKCPYIRDSYVFDSRKTRVSRANRSKISCLYCGADGTSAFANYYQSPRFFSDLQYKTSLVLIINQYIGRCLVDSQTSREEVKQWTLEAYRSFWTQVLDQSMIQTDLHDIECAQLTTIYVRLGDQYLCQHDPHTEQPLSRCYQHLQGMNLVRSVVLIGDVDQLSMAHTFRQFQKDVPIISMDGPIAHSYGTLTKDAWIKIFTDLTLMLKSPHVVILNHDSNFPRIVLFLKESTHVIDYLLPSTETQSGPDGPSEQLHRLDDVSTIFAKHYQF